jgi:anti-sigma regulatory factor (Ser/Thr protein kinase)
MANGSTISEKPKGLHMRLPARAENVAVVRHALAGLAEQIGMDETGVADLKTVVTEACMNVVVHAYPAAASGPLMVEADPDDGGLTVTVSDSGSGISPQAESERASLRLGLSLIAALSSSFSISGGLDRGTEVMMRLPLQGGANDNGAGEEKLFPEIAGAEIAIGRAELLEPVLARMVAAFAARRDLPVDRVSDVVLITDAIAEAAPGRFSDGCVRLDLGESDKGLELRLGPMEKGAAGEIRHALEVPELGGSLEALADEFIVEESEDGEFLIVRFAGLRGA